jgi:hypothetical protein
MTKICILLLALVNTALGQTSADLSAKYPQIAAYKVRPDVQMTARFSGDGQVCEMTLEKRAETDSGIILGASFSLEEVRGLVDDLVPEDLRGRNLTKGRFSGSIEGISITTEYTYENVLVRAYGIRGGAAGYKVIIIAWPKRSCGEAQTVAR